MTLPVTSVIIPFRDRGTDPLRAANLEHVQNFWREFEYPMVVDDGRGEKELFNRSAAYNKGVQQSPADAEVFIFAESDMLVSPDQIFEAVRLAHESMGMVVPFSSYLYHSAKASEHIRYGVEPGKLVPLWRMDNCTSIGAVNVMSRRTLDAFGQFDERFEGNWYDDDAMKMALEVCTGAPTRFIQGPGHHLYHLPGHRGKHLTDKEKEATRRNRIRLGEYERAMATNNAAQIRRLLKGEI